MAKAKQPARKPLVLDISFKMTMSATAIELAFYGLILAVFDFEDGSLRLKPQHKAWQTLIDADLLDELEKFVPFELKAKSMHLFLGDTPTQRQVERLIEITGENEVYADTAKEGKLWLEWVLSNLTVYADKMCETMKATIESRQRAQIEREQSRYTQSIKLLETAGYKITPPSKPNAITKIVDKDKKAVAKKVRK